MRPLALDYDGDGWADFAIVRGGKLKILLSSSQYAWSVVLQ